MANNSSLLINNLVIDPRELYIWFVLSVFITIIGTLACCALLTVIIKQHNYRDGTNPLIIQLLAVDCFTLAIPALLGYIQIYLTQIGSPSSIRCKPVFFLHYLAISVSHLIQACLAVNRCTAVQFPHYFNAVSRRSSVILMTGTIWIITLCFSVPYIFGMVATYGQAPPLGHCTLLVNDLRVFGILGSFVTTIPFCIEGLCYAIILLVFQCQRHQIREPVTRTDVRREKKKRKENMISLVLLLCFLWYMVCYLPNTIISSYMGWYWRNHWNAFIWMRTLFGTAQAGTPV
ncbi:D(2) dopamine receptor A-like [Paramacrobiotus metropolitanus]|uniref:D(2) dopamine receptor A-like n=1 Tax=Paramacrobiotus metropolitanus TaxID=2943436 RepID=UPI002445E5D0|nr:D(2) dopamine receptor A-like [Paramacrobiotus metropolitanus]